MKKSDLLEKQICLMRPQHSKMLEVMAARYYISERSRANFSDENCVILRESCKRPNPPNSG
jgi:hypothetical protein